MAGITPDISTSSFKPLSLDEILMVPLAKQEQEDQAQLALDEFAALESQALGPDKEYVAGQIGAFKKEAGSLTDQLLNQGVDRNLINKVKTLRNKKTNELSLSGKTGQAAAAYNQYKENEKAIMARKDLTAEQKKLGLQEALTNYQGVASGGQYQDYVGTAHIDILNKAYDVAGKMTPQTIADSLGMTIDPQTGFYSDGTYVYRDLPAEQIERVIKQALESDLDLMAYASEVDRLGIAKASEEIAKAAQSAGNVFQVKDRSRKYERLPANMQPVMVDSSKGIIAPPNQNWESRIDINTEAAFNRTLEIPDIENSSEIFDENGVFRTIREGEESLYNNEDIDKSNKIISDGDEKGFEKLSQSEKREYRRAQEYLRYSKKTQDVELNQAKSLVEKVRENNPVFNNTLKADGTNYTDKEVYDIYVDAKKRSAKTGSQMISPRNPENTFYAIGKRMIGSDGGSPSIISQNIQLMNLEGEKGGYRVMMHKLGYSDDEADKFVEDLKQGSADSYSPGIPGMPGARRISFINSNTNKAVVLFAEPTVEESNAFKNVDAINQLIYSGESFKKLDPLYNGATQYAVAELRPETGRYEGATILAQPNVELTKDDIANISYTPAKDANGYVMPGVMKGEVTTGNFKGQTIYRTDLNAEIQSGIDKINRYNDTTRNAKTTAKEGSAAKQ